MEHKELISMTDYVTNSLRSDGALHTYEEIWDYAIFLKKKPEIWMFVPCNKNGEPMEKPVNYDLWKKYGDYTQYGKELSKECKAYQEAKERVIFEGFEKVDLIEKGSFSLVVGYRKIGVWKSLCGYWKFSKSIKTLEDLTGLGLRYRVDKV